MGEAPNIEETIDGSKGRHVIRGEDGLEAELTYSIANDHLIIIDHTGTPPAWRGMGVGEALVSRAVADARARDQRIIPLCPFAKAQFDKHPDWADVLGGHPKNA